MAGGGGTRLWPLSRQDLPKQFLHFGNPYSLLQQTAKRFLNTPIAKKIVVLTNLHYQKLVEKQLKEIDPGQSIHILVEPIRKNTAPAIALGIRYLEERCGCAPEDPVLVIPSDHLLEPEQVFLRSLEEIAPFARAGDPILFGIRPNKPETGYGYIQLGEQKSGFLYRVQRFVEKPDRRKAEEYLASGDYYWNAGIFLFSPKTFWQEAAKHAPALALAMQGDFETCLSRFSENPDISIDYAIWEKTERAVVCPLPISWSDIGCWDSVYDVLDKDSNLNVKLGNVLEIDTKNSLIFGNQKLIATIGLEDLLIVDTDEATYISKKGESQKVKELVALLSKEKSKVKRLYKNDEFEIFSYEIEPFESLSVSIPQNRFAHWIRVRGETKMQIETEKTVIENQGRETAKLLLVILESAACAHFPSDKAFSSGSKQE